MSRKSKLTDKQWGEVLKLHVNKVSIPEIAKRYGVTYPTIARYLSSKGEEIKRIAEQVVKAERDLAGLSLAQQSLTLDLAAVLRSISSDLAMAAKYGATSAHRMTMLANLQTESIDPTAPLSPDSVMAQTAFDRLTKSANAAAEIPMALLAANKDRIKEFNNAAVPAQGAASIKGMDPAQAASEYQKLMG